MKRLDQLFADIASEHLGIPTLATRMSDALDFHDVAVWSWRRSRPPTRRASPPRSHG